MANKEIERRNVYVGLGIFFGMIFLILYLWMSAAEAATNVTAGACINITAHNTTTNSSYTETVCGSFFLRNISKVLGYGELLNISEENITIVAPPLAVSPVTLCEFTANATPNVGLENVTFISNFDGPCRVNITIAGAPIPVIFQVPPEFILLPRNESEAIFNASLQIGNISEENSVLRSENEIQKSRIDELERASCNLNNKILLDGYKSLSTNSKKYLKDFTRVDGYISITQFSDYLIPGATGQERANADFYSSIALEQFAERGFADTSNSLIQSDRQNVTITTYKPIITEGCVEQLQSLQDIQDEGKTGGWVESGIFIGILVAIFFIGLVVHQRAPPGAWR